MKALFAAFYEQDVFVKHECPRNGHFFENCDLDIWPWPWQMTLTLVLKKGFYPRNIYVKYESSITYHSKAMANVKVFVDRQTDRPKTLCVSIKTFWFTIVYLGINPFVDYCYKL